MRATLCRLFERVVVWLHDFFAPRTLRYPVPGPLMPALCVPSEKFPVIDARRQIKWWCYTNAYGVHMVKAVDLQHGWSVESNEFRGRLPTAAELDYLVRFLQQCPLLADRSSDLPSFDSAARR